MVKINAGCGQRILNGYKNVDVVPSRAGRQPDIVADLRKIPLPDSCAEEVMAIHVVEHFHPWEVPDLLKEWRRLLKPEGLLVLELPNLIKCCRNIITLYEGGTVPMKVNHPDQYGMWGIFGDDSHKDPYMMHKYGWTPQTLSAELEKHGFGSIREMETVWHPVGRHYRDMRLEARKV
jgi:predicted SAM-dependent methyltransferase